MPPKKNDKLALWDQQLAERAAKATAVVAGVGGGGNFLSIRSGILSYQKVQIPNNTMNVIVLAQILENLHYAEAFDPDSPAGPDCYAYGDDRKSMVPHDSVESPYNPTCVGCPMKEWGSADKGRGKACGDVERLALVTEGDLEQLATAEIAYLKVPYFSTLEWAAYVRQLAEVYHKSFEAFVTKISVVPDAKSQFRVKFELASPIEFDQESYADLDAKRQEAEREIAFAYPKFDQEEEKPAPRGNGRAVPKTVSQRKPVPIRAAPPAPKAGARNVVVPGAAGIKVGASRSVKAPKF
jgi:hypothetical protein